MRYRAWLYCRVADHQPDTRIVLERQKAQLENFCAEHDMTIAGTSLVTGKGRDELRELLRCGIEQDSYDMIVTLSASRLARDTSEIINTMDALTQHGKGCWMVKDNIIHMPDLSIGKDDQQENASAELGGLSL